MAEIVPGGEAYACADTGAPETTWTSANVRARAERRRARFNVSPWLVLLLLVLLIAVLV